MPTGRNKYNNNNNKRRTAVNWVCVLLAGFPQDMLQTTVTTKSVTTHAEDLLCANRKTHKKKKLKKKTKPKQKGAKKKRKVKRATLLKIIPGSKCNKHTHTHTGRDCENATTNRAGQQNES